MTETATTQEPSAELWDSRTERLLGEAAVSRLAEAHVLVVGLGGVGGYAVEMLARTGVGQLTLVDADCVDTTNLNRQLIALRSTVGEPKAALFASRISDINPDCRVTALERFLEPDNVGRLLDAPDGRGYDYVVDAIDTVAPKVALLAECLRRGVKVVSSMGAGGRTDVTKVVYADLWSTRDDGLARAVRQRLKKLGLRRRLDVVASTEAPSSASLVEVDTRCKRTSFGTVAAIPSIFGIFLAQKAIGALVKSKP